MYQRAAHRGLGKIFGNYQSRQMQHNAGAPHGPSELIRNLLVEQFSTIKFQSDGKQMVSPQLPSCCFLSSTPDMIHTRPFDSPCSRTPWSWTSRGFRPWWYQLTDSVSYAAAIPVMGESWVAAQKILKYPNFFLLCSEISVHLLLCRLRHIQRLLPSWNSVLL